MGYDVDRFVTSVNDGLLCCICRDVLEDPLQGPCEHAYCSSCIRAWLVNENTCPEDRQLLYPSELRPLFRYMKNDLASLQIRCINCQAGCPVISSLENIDKHEEECDYHAVKCPSVGCNQMLEKRALEQHLLVCQFQTKRCPRGCGLAILNNEDRKHSCVAELRMSVELLRSELIYKVEEKSKDLEYKLETQKRFTIRRENALLGQVEELKSQVNNLKDELDVANEKINRKQEEIEEMKRESVQMMEAFKQIQTVVERGSFNCRQCTRSDRIKLM